MEDLIACRESRETTAPPDENTSNTTHENIPIWHREDGLQLTFSHGPKGGLGFVVGTDASSCDIVVAKTSDHRVSRRHCYLTFDVQRRLIVRDCSSNGTIVQYDRKGGQKRRNFTWIVGGHKVPNKTETIVITLNKELRFQVVVAEPRCPEIFFKNVDQFCAEITANNELPFGALGLQSTTSTAAASGTQTPRGHEDADTPNEKSILLEQKQLGRGSFSVVTHVWDVSTGLEYASKQFLNPSEFDWVREANLMKKISHEHLTQIVATIQEPSTRLILEYLPLGNLENQHQQRCFSYEEVVTILYQGLSALTYLHGQTPSISHRDIKPENILVLSRDPLHIKLADFGLSKANDNLATICGTPTYLAPELAQFIDTGYQQGFRYNDAVDIWSLGVVAYEYAFGLPQPVSTRGLSWCRAIVDALDDWESDALISLLSTMVVMEPGLRQSALKCLNNASDLLVRSCPSIRSPAARLERIHGEDDDGSTTILLGTPWGTQETSSEDRGKNESTMQASTKRQRSQAADSPSLSSRRDQSKRRQSEAGSNSGIQGHAEETAALSRLYSDVVKLFADLKMGEGLDEETITLVEELCKHLHRLNVTAVGHTQNDSSQTTVHAKTGSEEILIATLTSSELLYPPAELATHLIFMTRFRSSQLQSSNAASARRSEEYTDIRSPALGSSSAWTLEFAGSLEGSGWDVSQRGVTYPSELSDVCRDSALFALVAE